MSSAQSTVSMKSDFPGLDKPQDHLSETDITTHKEKTPAAPDAPADFVRTIIRLKWTLICAGFYVSCFLYGLKNTIAADIQSVVLHSSGNISKLTWLGSGFRWGVLPRF